VKLSTYVPPRISFVHEVEVEVEVNLRPVVSRPVSLDVRCPFETRDQFFFLLEISFVQLRVCYFVSSETPPTWRARSPYLHPPGTELAAVMSTSTQSTQYSEITRHTRTSQLTQIHRGCQPRNTART
jgi:hypothetical protein